MTQEILTRAEELQQELFTYLNSLVHTAPEVSYQDMTNTWLIIKLAELELSIKTNNHDNQND